MTSSISIIKAAISVASTGGQFLLIRILIGFLLLLQSCINRSENGGPHVQKGDPESFLEKEEGDPGSTIQIGGTYVFGEDIEVGPIGSVLIHPVSDSSALFFLDVNRGAPTYNMGQLHGEMTFRNNIGVYSSTGPLDRWSCELTFEFDGPELFVRSSEGKKDCGFGYGVYADHDFRWVDRSIPSFFIYGVGDTIWFEDLK